MNYLYRFLASLPLASLAIGGMAAGGSQMGGLTATVKVARTRHIHPHASLPRWFDWDRTHRGLLFLDGRREDIMQIVGGTSLISTYACRDITPILMHTGRLPKDYVQRLKETADWVDQILSRTDDLAAFKSVNYKRAVDLGNLHAGIGRQISPAMLGWDRHQRVAINQQAFAFVLYSFAWQPIESLERVGKLDPVKDARAIDDWFYLWRVLGYGLGVEDALLPRNLGQVRRVVSVLRASQYGAPAPKGADLLLRNQYASLVGYLKAHKMPENDAKTKGRSILVDEIRASPGLCQALGLGRDPEKGVGRLLDGAR
ncbi:MAG TPA: oxygenase MpaB family protein [Fimbriimonas sp.]|nr:oxygenase MpaB family protein [Fimbriimonas sp.]